MTGYEQGRLYWATVRDVPDVLVFRNSDDHHWRSVGVVGEGNVWHQDWDVADIRPATVVPE